MSSINCDRPSHLDCTGTSSCGESRDDGIAVTSVCLTICKSFCTSDLASDDQCAHLQIIFIYLLTYFALCSRQIAILSLTFWRS